jgi:hypothetical protein
MSYSVCNDIKSMLVAESSLDLVFGKNLHIHREPPHPDNTVTVFETPGMPPIGLLDSNEDTKHYERPSIQIRIRNTSADAGFNLAYTIQNILQARAQETWGAYLYSVIYASSNPMLLDWDEVSRVRIVLNFNIQRRLK